MSSATISQGLRVSSPDLFSPALGASVIADVTPIVFVADNDVSVRESLQLLIRREGWQPRAFASAQEFFAWPPALVPNCLILDVCLAGLDGLDVQRRVSIERPEMPIIFITGHGDVRTTVQAMKAGAFEFLTKPFRNDVMLNAIREALERSRVALGHEAEMSVLRDCYVSLSPRERQVMELVVSGLSNKQVGGELGISEITVKAHRGKVMQKMNAGSLPDLVKMAGKLGLALSKDYRGPRVNLLRRMNYERPTAIGGFNQPVSETNKYGGKSYVNYERTYQTRADSHCPTVARLLARHDRQSANQRYGPGNGPAIPGCHRRSRGR